MGIISRIPLFEYINEKTELIEREVNGKKKPMVRGIFGNIGIKNQNTRIYPREEVEREIKKINEKIKSRSLLGELDHPEDMLIHLENVSHLITDLKIEGNYVYGEAEILETPKGKILETLLKSNITVGVSSRGSGELDENTTTDGEGKWVRNFDLVTYDMVADPSVKEACMNKLEESMKRILSSQGYEIYRKAFVSNEILPQDILSVINEIFDSKKFKI